MNGRLTTAIVAISAGLGLGANALAADPAQFANLLDRSTRPSFVPRTVDARPATVVVVLAGDDVATVQKQVGRPLSRSERQSVVAQLSGGHSAATPEIQRRGGQVLGHLHSALNGIKVSIPRNRIDTLRSIPGVVDVRMVGTYEPTNATSVPFIGAPAVWQLPPKYQGQGVRIAIIDTGIDYTHANFGGPGTVAAFQAAKATSTAAADPSLFGPAAPKVKGGIDLVGDAYNAAAAAGSPALIPHPDANPLDCGGHGSHVAGTAAGFGVTADGKTYAGPYSQAAYTPGKFNIGPGVAPLADLYAVRVFGCTGSTNVVAEAIDWAVANGMDVISMSLGSDFGADSAEALAVKKANDAGILVVAASGNAGQVPYVTSAPASIDGVISVAATDATSAYPFARLTFDNGSSILVQDSNGVVIPGGSYPIVVLRNANGTVSLGCNPDEYDKTKNGGIDVAGKIVVTVRGSCARVYRAGAAQHYGAAAAAMINSSAGYPAYEGPIPGGDPATNPFEPVTIPFYGVQQSDAVAVAGPTGGPAPAFAAAAPAGAVANPGFERIASFSSSGPRIGDSALRPGVTAPGVATVSTAVGTGNGFVTESGTSMATPHVAGVAALVREVNRGWTPQDQRAAIVQTAAPSLLKDYSPINEGAGLVQPLAAVSTQAVFRIAENSVSFGYADLLHDFSATRDLVLHNNGPKAIQFALSSTQAVGPAGATLTLPPTVTVAANSDAVVSVTLQVPAVAVGGTHDASGRCCLFEQVSGTIRATPTNSRVNGNVSLTVPYLLVAHTRSNLTASTASLADVAAAGGNLTVSNPGGAFAGTPDFYTLGLEATQPSGVQYADARAVGVQSLATTTGGKADRLLVFAINTFQRFSNAAGFLEWDIAIDSTGSGTANYVLVAYNGTAFSTSTAVANKLTAALVRLSDGAIVALRLADVATDNSTVLLPVLASELGLSAAQPRLSYTEAHFDFVGNGASLPGVAKFNAFAPALTVVNGGAAIPTNGTAAYPVTLDSTEAATTPPKGLMVVAPDNASGASQALLVK